MADQETAAIRDRLFVQFLRGGAVPHDTGAQRQTTGKLSKGFPRRNKGRVGGG